jgi:hypothetical protein
MKKYLFFQILFCVLLLNFLSLYSIDKIKIGEVTANGPVIIHDESDLKSAFDQSLNDGSTSYKVSIVEPLTGYYYLVGNSLRSGAEITAFIELEKDENNFLCQKLSGGIEINSCEGCFFPCNIIVDGNGKFSHCSTCSGAGFCNHIIRIPDKAYQDYLSPL